MTTQNVKYNVKSVRNIASKTVSHYAGEAARVARRCVWAADFCMVSVGGLYLSFRVWFLVAAKLVVVAQRKLIADYIFTHANIYAMHAQLQ